MLHQDGHWCRRKQLRNQTDSCTVEHLTARVNIIQQHHTDGPCTNGIYTHLFRHVHVGVTHALGLRTKEGNAVLAVFSCYACTATEQQP